MKRMSTDEFEIDLNLHHPLCDPEMVTEALALKPWFAVKKGAKIGNVTHKQTTWLCRFRSGTFESEFASALDDVATLLSEREPFITGLIEQGGNVELVLNSTVETEGDKLLEFSLCPWFLKQLGEHGVNLRVQAWSAQKEIANAVRARSVRR